ncbi:aminotransferase class III-fold pyridoxal phosphate-dependent enzyme [Aquamicrobium sp. LC103]|uniref:aminotransferase class III-fold pyridoxal phosphate-dependent enzyme n=1 Tax=Aquamicrobium sp. LC103 TaxID=1120658 RepID=UPI00063EBA75|nr:aminotransferase class III-fold pyridoxal phosphate-dependent enzyme [Aquamicrobium sp. LC103]TKT78142.1 aminotransferase class III-fold pyridoxal phosphate-dependent enzyme [Aquamicrobium sp. LC103]
MNAPSHLPSDVDPAATIIAEFNRLTAASKHTSIRNRQFLADKSAVSLPYSREFKEAFYPIVAERAEGAYLHDVDGRRYVDILMGLGSALFGHNPAFIRTEIEKRLAGGFPVGPQSALAGETAELFCRLTGMDRVTFSNTGSEAVAAAIRIARAATGRDRIAVFTNSYHGHNDQMLGRARRLEYIRRGAIARAESGALATLRPLLEKMMFTSGEPGFPGIPRNTVGDVIYLDYGNPKSLDVLRRKASRLAAVLVEPVQSRVPELQPREFLHALREITEKSGAALIFDEMITGFRVAPGGAQEHFGVEADLATYSKIAGGGMPLSLIAGRSRWMQHVDGGALLDGERRDEAVATTFFAGTFCRHPLALAAARASALHLLERGPSLQQELNARTDALVERLNRSVEAESLPIAFTSFGSFFAIAASRSAISPKTLALLSLLLLSNGIHLRVGDRGGFLSTAHSDEDVDFIHDGFLRGLRTLADFRLLNRLDGSTST